MRRVGYDIDNVLTQTYKFALDILNRHKGTDFTIDDCLYQTIEECFPWLVTPEEVMGWFRDPKIGFPEKLVPIDGARHVINRYDSLLDQYFISARNLKMEGASLDYFDREGFLYVAERVRLGNNTPEKKAALVKDLGLELFTEDDINNANAIAEVSGIPVCLLMYKFNVHAIEERGIIKHGLVIPVYEPFWSGVEGELKRML